MKRNVSRWQRLFFAVSLAWASIVASVTALDNEIEQGNRGPGIAKIAPAAPPLLDVISADVSRFTSLLSSAVPERRVEGIQGLAHLKHWPAENAVLELLNDPSPRVQAEALLALTRLGGIATMPRLIERLDDASWQIRQNALLGLRLMSAQDFDAEEAKAWNRWWTSSTLLEKQRALLIRMGQWPSNDVGVPQNPTETLHQGYVPTAPGRRARARSSWSFPAHSDRRAALRALVHLATPSLEPALLIIARQQHSPPLDSEEIDFLCEALERTGSHQAIPVLAMLRRDAAAWALGSLGGPEAEKALFSFPMTLATLLALDRLHSTNAGPLLPYLVRQMGLITYRGQPDDVMNENPQPIQRVGARLIQRSGLAPLFIERVLQALEDTMIPPRPHGSRPETPPDWEPLFQAMQSELKPGFVREDGTTTTQPVAAMCYTAQDPALAARLVPLLRHPAYVVRIYVAMTLGRLHAGEAVPDILSIIREGYPFRDAVALASGKHFDKSQTVRWRGFLCMALGRLGSESARQALEALAVDATQPRDIRYGAVAGLGLQESPDSLPALELVASQDIIWMIRDQARQAARNIRWSTMEVSQ